VFLFFIVFWPLGALTLPDFPGYGEPGYEAHEMISHLFLLILSALISLIIALAIATLITYIFELRAKMKKFVAPELSKP